MCSPSSIQILAAFLLQHVFLCIQHRPLHSLPGPSARRRAYLQALCGLLAREQEREYKHERKREREQE